MLIICINALSRLSWVFQAIVLQCHCRCKKPFLPLLCSVLDNASHLESPAVQLMVLPKLIIQAKCGFSRLFSVQLMAAIGSLLTTDGTPVVNSLVHSIYSTMGDLLHDPKYEIYKPQQYVIAFWDHSGNLFACVSSYSVLWMDQISKVSGHKLLDYIAL